MVMRTFTFCFGMFTSATVPLKLTKLPSTTRTASPISNSIFGAGRTAVSMSCSVIALTWRSGTGGIFLRSVSLVALLRLGAPMKPVTFGVFFTACHVSAFISMCTKM